MNKNTVIYDIDTLRTLLIPKFQKYGVVKGGLIGSYARNEATAESDIDLLFTINRDLSLSEWDVFEDEIQNCLGKEVDFIEFGSFSPRVEKEVNKELIIIYDQTRS